MTIVFIVLIIVNWIIYHKIFDVVYFRLGAALFKEFAICFFLAGIEVAILSTIGAAILPAIITIGGILLAIIAIYNFVKQTKEVIDHFKKTDKDSTKSTDSKDVKPTSDPDKTE